MTVSRGRRFRHREADLLAQRIVSIVVLAPLVLFIVYLGGGWYVALVATASLVGNWEFYSLLRRAGYAPLWPFGLLLSLAFVLDAYPSLVAGQLTPPALAFLLTLSLVYLMFRRELRGSLVDWAITWVPPLYAGFLLAFLVSLRFLPQGEKWVYFVLAVTWATDVAAYVVGRLLGRRRFFPRISPRKTLEGATGGLIAGVVSGGLLAWFFGWDVLPLLVLALLASVAAEAGDLAESLLKRQLRAKDASRLIPGHGGVLDRMDSLLFVGVVTYFWALWVGGNL